jgi:hypothetical protein
MANFSSLIAVEFTGVSAVFKKSPIADWLRKQCVFMNYRLRCAPKNNFRSSKNKKQNRNPTPSLYARAVDNFVRSCAGAKSDFRFLLFVKIEFNSMIRFAAAYVVATYVIGVQDRHNDKCDSLLGFSFARKFSCPSIVLLASWFPLLVSVRFSCVVVIHRFVI